MTLTERRDATQAEYQRATQQVEEAKARAAALFGQVILLNQLIAEEAAAAPAADAPEEE